MEGDTALIEAALAGRTAVVKTLIEKGADVNIHNLEGDTALIEAALAGRTAVVKTLIEKGADINIPNKSGNTALMIAAQEGRTGIVKTLIEEGAVINIPNKSGNTALHYAVRGVRPIPEVVTMLLDHGADMGALNHKQQTPRDLAADQPPIMSVFNNLIAKVKRVADNVIRNDQKEHVKTPGLESLCAKQIFPRRYILPMLCKRGGLEVHHRHLQLHPSPEGEEYKRESNNCAA